jgi:hypothetical protein
MGFANARRHLQHQPVVQAWRGEPIRQRGLAVRQRPRLVEDDGAAAVDALEHGGIADDDAPLGGEGNGADDRHGNADQQRTRRCDHQHREKSDRIAAPRPCRDGEGHGDRRIPGAQLIAQPAEPGASLFGVPHDAHDPRIARIDGHAARPQRQGVLAVDRAGEHLRSGRLRHHERLAREIGLVHDAVSFDDDAVDGADFMRVHDEFVADAYVGERYVRDLAGDAPMRSQWHSTGERLQDRGRPPEGKRLQRFAA